MKVKINDNEKNQQNQNDTLKRLINKIDKSHPRILRKKTNYHYQEWEKRNHYRSFKQ